MTRPKTHPEAERFNVLLGDELTRLTQQGFVSQGALARLIESYQPSVSQWLKGRHPLPVTVFYDMCLALRVPPEDIVRKARERLEEEKHTGVPTPLAEPDRSPVRDGKGNGRRPRDEE